MPLVNADVKKTTWYERNKLEQQRRNKLSKELDPEKHKKWSRDSYHRNKNTPEARVKNLWKHAKARAVAKNLPFDIELSDIVIPTYCPIMVTPIGEVGSGKYAPSIDRIIPEKGHVKGNIQVISLLANQMKWNASEPELWQFCTGMLRTLEERGSVCH